MSNSAMEYSMDLEQRLIGLEIKATFQEDLLEELNQTVFRQQQQIDLLIRDVVRLSQNSDGGTGGSTSARDELPPHY